MALRGTAPELGDISCAYCIGGMRHCVSVGWLPFLIEVHIKTLIGSHLSPQLQTNGEKPAELRHLPYGMWWGQREVISRLEPIEIGHSEGLPGDSRSMAARKTAKSDAPLASSGSCSALI